MRAWTCWRIGIVVMTLAPGAHAEGALRIEDAVRFALSRNERGKQAELRVDAAAGTVERARAAFLPSLSVGGSVVGDAAPSRDGRTWSTAAVATLTQPLVAPSAWPAYAQAKRTLEAERAGSVEDQRRLAYDTAKAFLQTLAAEQVLMASRSRRDRANGNLMTAQARAKAELASVNDATRASLDLASADRDVVQQEGAVKRTYLSLSLYVDAPVRGPLAPPDGAARALALVAQGADALVRDALARRPDIHELTARAEALNEAAKEPSYRLIPTLALTAQGRAVPDAPAPSNTYDGTLTLSLNWNLFDGGARYGDRQQRLAQLESGRLAERLLRRGVDVDVKTAIAAFDAAKEVYAIAEQAVTVAKRNTEETQVLYMQGLARVIELTDANGREYDAEVSRVAAKLALEQACIDLRYALGLDPVEGARDQKGAR